VRTRSIKRKEEKRIERKGKGTLKKNCGYKGAWLKTLMRLRSKVQYSLNVARQTISQAPLQYTR
jgi:hypothetical protein